MRTINKSLRVQEVFDNLSGVNKSRLVGKYFNFKYHLFYSLFGSNNDSCLVYDVRYNGWKDWRLVAANDATRYTDSNGAVHFYFGEPTTGEVHELYEGTTDDGTSITSTCLSKSYDYDLPDTTKLFMDSTFIFGALTGSVTVSVIFNDSEVTTTKAITQTVPQGGFGRDAFGRSAFGAAVNTVTVTQVVGQPQRMKTLKKKFAIQYKVTSAGSWRLDKITQTFIPFTHYLFPGANKLN